MKNKLRILQLLVLTLIFFSCQTEDITKIELNENSKSLDESALYNFNVEVKNGILSFPTREDYEKAIVFLGPQSNKAFKAFEDQFEFKSMRNSTNKEHREEIGIYDDLLATIINPEGSIEISNTIFNLDALNETVTLLKNSDYVNKSSFISSKAKLYSVNSNVLDIADGSAEADNSDKIKWCKRNKSHDSSFNINNNGTSYKVDWKLIYQNAGFLRSLVADIHKNKLESGGLILGLKTVGTNYYRKRRGGNKNFSQNDGQGTRREYDLRPYYSTKRLRAYRFRAEFTVIGDYDASFVDNISCN